MFGSKQHLLTASCFALGWVTACGDDETTTTISAASDTDGTTMGTSTTAGTSTSAGSTSASSGTTSATSGSTGTTGGSTSGDSTGDTDDPTTGGSTGDTDGTGTTTGALMCGDNLAEGGEVCDGTDLGGEDCASQGFADGTLACAGDCMAFDTTLCNPACVDDGFEDNDTDATATPIVSPFSTPGLQICGGDDDFYALTAADDDTIDARAAFSNAAGDLDMILLDPTGALVDSSTSVTDDEAILYTIPPGEGGTYVVGMLGFMGAENAYDLQVTVLAACLPGEFRCDDAVCIPGAAECDGTLDCPDGSDELPTNPSCPEVPEAGDLVINEIMQNPDALPDSDGEYFEVFNPSFSTTYDLQGCEIFDLGSDLHTIAGSVPVPPQSYVTLARSAVPGFTPDYVYADVTMSNGSDEIGLRCNAVIVDEVDWDGGPAFPDPTGAAMSLDPTFQNAGSNDNGANWCASTLDLGTGDFGTPGADNGPCVSTMPTEVITGCDPAFCLVTGTGPNGGTLMVFVIPPDDRPAANDVEASCFGGGAGADLLINLDTTGFSNYTVSTCNITPADSSVATYDGDPTAGGAELACSEDASGEPGFCSELTDSGAAGPALPTPSPASDSLWIVVDEWDPGDWWNTTTSRTIEVELIP